MTREKELQIGLQQLGRAVMRLEGIPLSHDIAKEISVALFRAHDLLRNTACSLEPGAQAIEVVK